MDDDREYSVGPRRALLAPAGPDERVFVGRMAELNRIRAALDTIASSPSWAIQIGGEPGIGKTTLLREIAREASRRGVVVAGRSAGMADRARRSGRGASSSTLWAASCLR